MSDQKSSAAPAKAPVEEYTLELRKPITVHGKTGPEQVSELNFKLPPASLILYDGLPYAVINEETADGATRTEVKINPVIARKYLEKMTGRGAVDLEGLHPADAIRALNVVVNMIHPFGS